MNRNMVNVMIAVLTTVVFGMAGCGGGGGGGNGKSTAITGGVFRTGNFVVTVADNSIPSSAHAAPVATAASSLPANVKVSSYETNVTSGAKAYTLKIGDTGFKTATVGTVRLEVPFDRSQVPDQSKIDSLHLLLRISNTEDNSVVTLTGQIVGDKVAADLTGFPSSATVTVLFNPNMDVVTNDAPTAKSVPLSGETWTTRKWAVIYDTVEVTPEVQKFLGMGSAPTPAQIRAALKAQIADHAADAAAIYQGEGFRSPTLFVAKTATEPGGTTYGTSPRYFIHFQKQQSANFTSEVPHDLLSRNGDLYGRIYIQDTDLNESYSAVGMSIYGTIAHELFHAVQGGYNLMSNAFNGVVEGTATAYGDLLDRRHNGDPNAIPQTRKYPSTNPDQVIAETFKLESYLLTNTGVNAYANQDFFVYLARTIGSNNFKYLATLFEQIRITTEESGYSMETLYKAFDAFLSSTSATTLVTAYGDFVRQRAIEHNSASLFGRPGETVSGLALELFPYALSKKDVHIDPTATSTTTLNDLHPLDTLSARVIKLSPTAGNKGNITISVAPGKGTLGTTLSGWIYRKPNAAASRTSTPLLASNTISGFGTDSADEVIIVLINPSFVTSAVNITCEIKAAPSGRFIDKGNGTMYDTVSNLTWLKKADCFFYQTWDEAIMKSNALATGQCGLTDGSKAGDWHLPTITELRIFADDGFTAQTLNSAGFINMQYTSYYWSSTTSSRNSYDPTFYKWYVNMSNGTVYDTYKTDTNSVLPVRVGQ